MPVSFLVRILLWVWLGAAIAAGHFHVLQRMPPVVAHATVPVLVALLLLGCLRLPAFRRWIENVDLRALALIHVTRFAGIYFLILHQRGELPRAYVVPGSVTDIIVAAMALPVALAPLEDAPRRRALVIWNVVGFGGILFTLINVTRISLADPGQLRGLTQLPLSLVPTLLLPLLLATHVMIFIRTARPPAGA